MYIYIYSTYIGKRKKQGMSMRRVIVENSGRRGKLESREEGVVIAEHTRGIPSIRLGTLR